MLVNAKDVGESSLFDENYLNETIIQMSDICLKENPPNSLKHRQNHCDQPKISQCAQRRYICRSAKF
jgi:hypothetical protein